MIYKFRIILDAKDNNVIREVEIKATQNFEEFHMGIYEAFGFDGTEMAVFYLSDENWNQGEEIVLMDMGIMNQYVMVDTIIEDLAEEIGDRFLYVYDLMELWTFYVELVEIKENSTYRSYPQCVAAIGEMIKEAPQKDFVPTTPANNFGLDEFSDNVESDFQGEEDEDNTEKTPLEPLDDIENY